PRALGKATAAKKSADRPNNLCGQTRTGPASCLHHEAAQVTYMNATDRQQGECAFHDQQAWQRAATFRQRPQALFFEDDFYLDHETWIRPAFEQLGEVRGLNVLDYGCGHAMAAVVLARRGASVTAFDLSPGYLEEARRRAQANGISVQFAQAN